MPARLAGEAAAAAVGRLWVGWRVQRGGELAQARPSGCAGGMCKRARGAEAVGGVAWAALSDVTFARVSQCFGVLAMFARPPSQFFGDEGIVLSWQSIRLESGCALPRGAAAGSTLRWIESGPKTQDFPCTRVNLFAADAALCY